MDKFLTKIYLVTTIIILLLILIASGIMGFKSLKDEPTSAGSVKPDMVSAGPEIVESVSIEEKKSTVKPKPYSAAGSSDEPDGHDAALARAAMGMSTDYVALSALTGAFTWV